MINDGMFKGIVIGFSWNCDGILTGAHRGFDLNLICVWILMGLNDLMITDYDK